MDGISNTGGNERTGTPKTAGEEREDYSGPFSGVCKAIHSHFICSGLHSTLSNLQFMGKPLDLHQFSKTHKVPSMPLMMPSKELREAVSDLVTLQFRVHFITILPDIFTDAYENFSGEDRGATGK